jgi:hypothetical protein
VDCNPCPHGKRKHDCAACNPCPHGKLKRFCAACKSRNTRDVDEGRGDTDSH